MTVRVRLAPSPTGNLHIGTARTAVFNWLYARHNGGQFILRVEDTDLERSRPEYTENILEGLTWLGLNWDAGPFFQSQRLDYYRQMIQTLLDKGLAYRCYCTEEELTQMREAQKANKEAPRYDNRHRNLTQEERDAFEAEGRTSVIRFKIDDDRQIIWNDLVRDEVSWRGSDLGGDMVIARASTKDDIGQPLYNLAVVVDDIDMRITHVIRGEDHIGNTPKQILLYEAFEAKIPEFAHTPLILNQSGQKLSKRDGVTSISDFKQMGYTAEALVNYMTLLGWSSPDNEEIFTLAPAAEKFSFDRVNKAGAKFDWDKLNSLNRHYIQAMPVPQLTDLLIPYWQEAGYQFDPIGERAWLEQLTALIGPSFNRLDEAVAMSRVFFVQEIEFHEEAADQLQQPDAPKVLQAILAILDSQQPLTESDAQDAIKKVTKEQNVKKGMLMRSLRAALTGEVHGPDLIQSWLLLHQRSWDKTRLQSVLGVNDPQEGAMTELPTPEQPIDETPSATSLPDPAVAGMVTEPPPPDAWVEQETPAPVPTEDQFQQIRDQVLSTLSDLPTSVTEFFAQNKKLINSFGLIIGVLLGLRVLQALLDVFNSIPLLGGIFEVVGMGYSGWFIYRYLLQASHRQELTQQIQSIKEQIAGKHSANQ